MFSHQPTEIVVVTDTLATSTAGEPTFFVTKTFVVPHLQLVAAMTGTANVGQELIGMLFSSLLSRDIDMAATHTQAMLRGIESGHLEQYPDETKKMTSTVYYFGHSERQGQYVRYAFRSTNGFEPQLTTDAGFGVKPEPDGGFEVPETLEDWVALAERIRTEQKARPPAERIHVGGELHLTAMTEGNITSWPMYRFADIEDQWHAMHDYHDAWTASPDD